MRRPFIALILAVAVGPTFASVGPDPVEGARNWALGRYSVHLSDPGSYLNCREQPGLNGRVHAVLGHGEDIEAVGLAKADALWLETALGCFVIADAEYVRPADVSSAVEHAADTPADAALRRIGAPVELTARTSTPLSSSVAGTLAPPQPPESHLPDGDPKPKPELEEEQGEESPAEISGSEPTPAIYATEPVLSTDRDAPSEIQSTSAVADNQPLSETRASNEANGGNEVRPQSAASDAPPHWLPGTYAVITRQPAGRVNCRDLPSIESAVFVSMPNGDLFDVTYVTKREQPWLLTEHECFVKADDSYLKAVKQDVPSSEVVRRPLRVPQVRLGPGSHSNGVAPDEHWSVGRYRVNLNTPAGHLNCRDMPSTRATIFRKLAHGETVEANFIVHTNGVWMLTTHECFIKADTDYLTQPSYAEGAQPALPPSGSAAAE